MANNKVARKTRASTPARKSIIPEHKWVEQRLGEREAELYRFKYALDQTLDCVFMFRMEDFRFNYVNLGAQRQVGYTEAELLAMSPLDLKPEYTPESFRQLVQPLIDGTQASITFDTVHRHKNGHDIPVEIVMQLVLQSVGERRFVAIVRDITERKRSEEARANLAAIVDNANDAIISRSIDGAIQSWNKAAERMFGWSAQEIIGKPITILVPPERRGEVRPFIERVMRGEKVGAVESMHRHRDGSLIDTSVTFSPTMDEAGKVVSLSFIYRNISKRKKTERALRESEERYRSVIAAIAEGVVLRDKDAKIVACNASAERILGRTLDQMLGNVLFDSAWQAIQEDGTPFPAEDRPLHVALRNKQMLSNVVQGLSKPDGTVLWLSVNVQPLFDESGTKLFGLVSTFTDITERRLADQRQKMEHAVTRILAEADTLAEATPRIIRTICETMGWHCGARWQMDKEAGVLRCIECWGIDKPEIREFMAENLKRIVNPESTPDRGLVRRVYNTQRPIWIADISKEKDFNRAHMVIKAGLHGAFGFPMSLGGEVLGVMEFFHRDVREPDASLLQIADSIGNQIGQFMARRQAEERIRHLANYDELTGLPNRTLFNERLAHALAQARRNDRQLAVLFIDLDRFKNINDTLGHDAGDLVLKEVADRLRGCLRDSDSVGRLGGDEFVVLIEEPPQISGVSMVAQKILEAVARPFILAAQEYHIGATIGISAYPEDGMDMQTLLKHADAAMYHAKEQGGNNYHFHSAQIPAPSSP
ncbi:MAG: PAS domain S-box protein [Burkholderiales bacterium]|nr:PAS domain S-box protein [Burkholderiales bacterium]